MAVTSANVYSVTVSGTTIKIHETGRTKTTNTKESYADVISFLTSTDSALDVRKEAHAALRAAGYRGTLGNFGG